MRHDFKTLLTLFFTWRVPENHRWAIGVFSWTCVYWGDCLAWKKSVWKSNIIQNSVGGDFLKIFITKWKKIIYLSIWDGCKLEKKSRIFEGAPLAPHGAHLCLKSFLVIYIKLLELNKFFNIILFHYALECIFTKLLLRQFVKKKENCGTFPSRTVWGFHTFLLAINLQ